MGGGGGLPSSQIYCYGGEYHLHITAELHTIHLIILAWGGRSSIHVYIYRDVIRMNIYFFSEGGGGGGPQPPRTLHKWRRGYEYECLL